MLEVKSGEDPLKGRISLRMCGKNYEFLSLSYIALKKGQKYFKYY